MEIIGFNAIRYKDAILMKTHTVDILFTVQSNKYFHEITGRVLLSALKKRISDLEKEAAAEILANADINVEAFSLIYTEDN